jgi:hypothetical protein
VEETEKDHSDYGEREDSAKGPEYGLGAVQRRRMWPMAVRTVKRNFPNVRLRPGASSRERNAGCRRFGSAESRTASI